MRTFAFDDVARDLVVEDNKGRLFEERAFEPGVRGGAPAVDLGLVVATMRDATARGIFRAIVCAGFTTYGTAAAAEYMCSDLTRMNPRQLRALTGARRNEWSGDFLLILRAEFERGRCTEIRAEYGAVLGR